MRRKNASGRLMQLLSSWHRSATGRRRGSHWGTLRHVVDSMAKPHACTGTLLKRSRKSASKRGGRAMKFRLILLLANLALLAAWFGGVFSDSWPDGHGFL